MIRQIVKYGDPVLRAKGAVITQVTDDLRALAADMLDTMREANGVGLAAQQVGVPVQLTVIDVAGIEDRPSTMWIEGREVVIEDWMPMFLLNPQIDLADERVLGNEGCLSFPEITAEIDRAAKVRARGQLLDGRNVEFEASGLLARALQHEIDHLHGVLFIDRMDSATKVGLSGKLKRLQREGARGR